MKILYVILLVLVLGSCQTIEKKSQEAIKKENEKLSKYLQKRETDLKIEMGIPDEIIYNDMGVKFLIYKKKKFNITCERKFEVDKSQIVIGFTSKGCF